MSAASVDSADPGGDAPVVGRRTLPRAHVTPAPSTHKNAPCALVCVKSAYVLHAASAAASASAASEGASANTCSPPATSRVPPSTAPVSSSRRPRVGTTTHAAARTPPMSSVRACASDGLAPDRWFTTSRDVPSRPITRGMSWSSKPGMPSVNLNTANSSSSAARVVVRRRGETHRRGTTAAGAYRAPFRPASLAVGAWVELTAARIAQ